MKIIYIANIRFPTDKAHGVQIAKMCESFGHKNKTILLVPWRFNKIKQDVFKYYGVEKNFKIKKLPSLDLIFFRIPKIGFIIQSAGFYFFVFVYLLFANADIFYSRELLAAYLFSFIKKNVVCELHTMPSWFDKRYLRNIKKIIVITYGIKQELIENGVDGNDILVVPDGVDIGQFDISISKQEAREKINLSLNKKIILYAGHLYKWKGPYVLARATQYLSGDYLIVFVGGTEKDVRKIKKWNEQNKYKNILILGHKPYSQIPYYLKAADVLVMSNTSNKKISRLWTSPMKMFEYMASQCPIIASDLPSIREVLNENNALLVRSDNSQLLADKIMFLLKDEYLCDRLSQQAYNDVKQYDWCKRTENILQFIKNE